MSTSKYVLNFDELSDDLIPKLRSLSKEVDRKPFELNKEIEKNLQDILDKMPGDIDLTDIIQDITKLTTFFKQIDELKGDFHVDGEFKNIPAISSDYEVVFNYTVPIYLTGVVFSLSAWREFDKWSLIVNNNILFDKVSTKEVGDKKYFNVPYFVDTAQDIKVVFHNISGNSRQVWCDLEYITPQFADMVLVKCIDTNGILLQMYYTPITAGVTQTVTAPGIPHYFLITSPDYVERVFTANNNVITFVYDKLLIVHVKCIDKNNGNVLKEYSIETKPNETSTIDAPTIDGYNIAGTSEVSKIFKDGDNIVFEYAKSINITIKCVDEYGKLLENFTKQVIEGETTTINAPDITGYRVISTNPIISNFTEGQVVEFTYTHPWGVKIMMQWQDNVATDLDMYGIYNNSSIVWFGHKVEDSNLWLDRDTITHMGNSYPEIMTCNYDTGKLVIAVNNYNGIPLSKPVTFTIIKYDSATNSERTVSTISVNLDTGTGKYAVCEIDLATKTVTELNHSTVVIS